MPPGGAQARAEQTCDGRSHRPRALRRAGRRPDAGRPGGIRTVAAVRLRRREPDSGDAVRLREGEKGSGGLAERDGARGVAGQERVGGRARQFGLQGIPAVPAADHRPEEALCRLHRRRRRPVRRPARRLRAGDADRRGAPHLRRAQGGDGTPDCRGGGAGRHRRQQLPAGRIPGRTAARVLPVAPAALRLHRPGMAVRPDGASLLVEHESRRHPPDDAVSHRQHRAGGVRRHPRVRARAVRARRQPVAGANAAVRRDVAGPARVAEPPLGEPRRQEPRRVDVLPPRTEAGVSRSAPRRGRGHVLSRHQQGAARG